EELFGFLVEQLADFPGVAGAESIVRQEKEISLSAPWKRLTLADAFATYADITLAKAQQKGCFEEVLVEQVEPHLGWDTPTFLYEYPIEMASLARPKEGDPGVAERFELYVGGLELANGFSELVDPSVQKMRFVQERELILRQGRSTEIPEQFIASLEHLGDTAGIALGVDRLAMLFSGKEKLIKILPIDVRFL
ncbi:MAG: EF-P lysine aminoacylase GenX, partial [Desulfobulbus propionicus]